MATQNDSVKLAVYIEVVFQNGMPGTLLIDINDVAQGQRILDQLNSTDEFVLVGEPAQTNTLRLNKSLVVSASIREVHH